MDLYALDDKSLRVCSTMMCGCADEVEVRHRPSGHNMQTRHIVLLPGFMSDKLTYRMSSAWKSETRLDLHCTHRSFSFVTRALVKLVVREKLVRLGFVRDLKQGSGIQLHLEAAQRLYD